MLPYQFMKKALVLLICGLMCLTLWQRDSFPALGQGKDEPDTSKGAVKVVVRQGETPLKLVRTIFPDVLSTLEKTEDIVTYEFFVNQLPENTPAVDLEAIQKQRAQLTASSEAKSKTHSRSLGAYVSKEEIELLSRIIYAEARGEKFEGQVAVGAVVLNRVKDSRFPNTIQDVVYQSGAFTAVTDKQIQLDPDDQAHKAAEAALAGQDPSDGALFYFNPKLAKDEWIKSRSVIKRIGNHTFSI